MNDITDFQTLDEAVSFWENHDSADFWDDMEEVEFEVEIRRNLLAAKLIVLAYRPESCPQCGQTLEEGLIDYLIDDRGRLLMVRDLPVLRCAENEHLYLLEETFDRLERLIALERVNKVKPASTLTIPVYGFVKE
jgi:hypothetical protein